MGAQLSLSATLTIIFRAVTPDPGSFFDLAHIHDLKYVVLILAMLGSVYSLYLVIYFFFKVKNSFLYLIKGNWIKRNSPLDLSGSLRRIAGSMFSNIGAVAKLTGGIAATGLTIDQTQDLLGVSENNDWRLKKNTRIFGQKLGREAISDQINHQALNQKAEINKVKQNSSGRAAKNITGFECKQI